MNARQGIDARSDLGSVPYTYAYDVHGSVSLLMARAGGATTLMAPLVEWHPGTMARFK